MTVKLNSEQMRTVPSCGPPKIQSRKESHVETHYSINHLLYSTHP